LQLFTAHTFIQRPLGRLSLAKSTESSNQIPIFVFESFEIKKKFFLSFKFSTQGESTPYNRRRRTGLGLQFAGALRRLAPRRTAVEAAGMANPCSNVASNMMKQMTRLRHGEVG
jgi:hypothetical protein